VSKQQPPVPSPEVSHQALEMAARILMRDCLAQLSGFVTSPEFHQGFYEGRKSTLALLLGEPEPEVQLVEPGPPVVPDRTPLMGEEVKW